MSPVLRRPFLRHKLFSYPRRFTNLTCGLPEYPSGLFFWPKYFTKEEQRTLLLASLHKLDNLETRQARKMRRDFWKSIPVGSPTSLLKMFAPDELYEFEEARSFVPAPTFSPNHLTCYVRI